MTVTALHKKGLNEMLLGCRSYKTGCSVSEGGGVRIYVVIVLFLFETAEY